MARSRHVLLFAAGCIVALGAVPLSALTECSALSQALPASSPSGKLSRDACAALTRPGAEDHWYFVSSRIDTNGMKSFHLPAASHDWLSTALQECASHGWIPKGWIPSGIPELAKGMPFQSDFFDYIPSVNSVDVQGRLVRLGFPKLADLSGDLAIRLEVTHEGLVLGKKLLFSSDPKLGQLVLDSLEAGLEIVRPGSGPGPFVDILTLKFQGGELAVFGQTHHSVHQEPQEAGHPRPTRS